MNHEARWTALFKRDREEKGKIDCIWFTSRLAWETHARESCMTISQLALWSCWSKCGLKDARDISKTLLFSSWSVTSAVSRLTVNFDAKRDWNFFYFFIPFSLRSCKTTAPNHLCTPNHPGVEESALAVSFKRVLFSAPCLLEWKMWHLWFTGH